MLCMLTCLMVFVCTKIKRIRRLSQGLFPTVKNYHITTLKGKFISDSESEIIKNPCY